MFVEIAVTVATGATGATGEIGEIGEIGNWRNFIIIIFKNLYLYLYSNKIMLKF